jgi:hypothetical protein
MRVCAKSSVHLVGLKFPVFVLLSPAGLPVATYATTHAGFGRAHMGMTWTALLESATALGGAAAAAAVAPVAVARAGFAAKALTREELDAVMACKGTATAAYGAGTISCVQSFVPPLGDRRYISIYLDRARGASACDTFVYSFSARYGTAAAAAAAAAAAGAAPEGTPAAAARVYGAAAFTAEGGDVLRLKMRRLITSIVLKLNRQRDRAVKGLALEWVVDASGGVVFQGLLGVQYVDAKQPSWVARAAVDPDSALVAQLAALMPAVSMPATDLLPSPRCAILLRLCVCVCWYVCMC